MTSIKINSEQAKKYAIKLLEEIDIDSNMEFRLVKAVKTRTLKQNSCLHGYCDDLAALLSGAGFEQRAIISQFKENFDVPWTMEAVKNIFRAVGKVMFDVESTKDLTTVQTQKVYQAVDYRISEITGIRSEWPSIESKGKKV